MSVKGEVVIEEPSAAQRAVARRTAEARATIPHLEMSTEIAMDGSLALLEREACSLDAVVVRACARALRAVPHANAAYRDGRFELYSRVNVGVVVTSEDTYVIPTVFDADRKLLGKLSAEIDELSRLARERRLTPPAFSGATFTLWNAAALGLTSSSAVVNPPQAAALTVGRVREITVMREGQAAGAHVLTATLACDHRILYGAEAARFLTEVQAQVEAS